jgi:hypothetical protein
MCPVLPQADQFPTIGAPPAGAIATGKLPGAAEMLSVPLSFIVTHTRNRGYVCVSVSSVTGLRSAVESPWDWAYECREAIRLLETSRLAAQLDALIEALTHCADQHGVSASYP